MDILASALALIVFWSLIQKGSQDFGFIQLIGLVLSLNFVGLVLISAGYGGAIVKPYLTMYGSYRHSRDWPVIVFATGLLSYALTIFLTRRIAPDSSALPQGCRRSRAQATNDFLVLLPSVVIVLVLSSLLFVKGGVPLLAADPNVRRFTIVRNLGPYWRMQSVGTVALLVLLMCYAYWARPALWVTRILFWIVALAAMVLAALRGNKGGVLTVCLFVVVALLTIVRSPWRRGRVLFGSLLFVIIAALATWVSSQVVLGLKGRDLGLFLAERLTSGAGMGFHGIVTYLTPKDGVQWGVGQVDGVRAILSTLRLLPPGAYPDLGTKLSHALFGWLPVNFPITVTWFGDFYYEFGLAGILIGGMLMGFASRWVKSRALLAVDPFKKAWFILLEVELILYANRGSLLGLADNDLLSLLIVVTPVFFFRGLLHTKGRVSVVDHPAMQLGPGSDER